MFNNIVNNISEEDNLDTFISELEHINDDYGYVQTYIYLFFFICLVISIILLH
jgi:hypothetical protein